MALANRLLATLLIAGTGCAFAFFADLHGVNSSSGYFLFATILLAVGLFSSTYEISIRELRRNLRVVLLAVTFGVLVKAALIAGVMYLIFRDPAYIILGVAMAQIDPLSVAVMRYRSRLSEQVRVILSAWSSLDDPVTAILAVYLSSVALGMRGSEATYLPGTSPVESTSMGFSGFVSGLLGNGLLVAGAAFCWWLLSRVGRRIGRSMTDDAEPISRSFQFAGILVLATIATVAVDNFWLLGLAIVGLFFRPGIGKVLSWAAPIALTLATFVLGVVLADGVALLPGLVLGVAAFGAQIIAGGLLVTWTLPYRHRFRLAFAQQSGITAVILALLLETVFPGTISVVAPAILVINTLHLIFNTFLDKREERAGVVVDPSIESGPQAEGTDQAGDDPPVEERASPDQHHENHPSSPTFSGTHFHHAKNPLLRGAAPSPDAPTGT